MAASAASFAVGTAAVGAGAAAAGVGGAGLCLATRSGLCRGLGLCLAAGSGLCLAAGSGPCLAVPPAAGLAAAGTGLGAPDAGLAGLGLALLCSVLPGRGLADVVLSGTVLVDVMLATAGLSGVSAASPPRAGALLDVDAEGPTAVVLGLGLAVVVPGPACLRSAVWVPAGWPADPGLDRGAGRLQDRLAELATGSSGRPAADRAGGAGTAPGGD